jgi:hypothetical protein
MFVIDRAAFAAYEKRAGFPGLGDFFERKGLLMYENENAEIISPQALGDSTITREGGIISVNGPSAIKVSS